MTAQASPPPAVAMPVLSSVSVSTVPAEALVLLGDHMMKSPANFAGIAPGSYSLRVMLAGYDPVEQKVDVHADVALPEIRLVRSKGSLQVTSVPTGAGFKLIANGEVVKTGTTPARLSDLPTGPYDLQMHRGEREVKGSVEVKSGEEAIASLAFSTGTVMVTSEPPGAEIVADGKSIGKAPVRCELLTGAHQIAARYDVWPEEVQTVSVEQNKDTPAVFEFSRGNVKLTSAPGGAQVFYEGKELGKTPLLIEDLKPGAVSYELQMPGYKPAKVDGLVEPGKQTFLATRLDQKRSPEAGKPWDNSLGMKFVPVGNVYFCIWETRVKDYDAFCAATGRQRQIPDFDQTPDHPVVKVSWNDAEAFCRWLTEKERAEGMLEDGQHYRLPADTEWSMAVGLPDEHGNTPEERDGKLKIYPWGKTWPPPNKFGNYADQNAKPLKPKVIDGYVDGFPQTAPVGSFAPNAYGIYDLSGNVWEWVEEGYKGSGKYKDWGVLRGGCWANCTKSELLSSYRSVVDRNDRDVIFGFRCVLVLESE
jgi:formylglycine-generating enzyme required for sulfatase activity